MFASTKSLYLFIFSSGLVCSCFFECMVICVYVLRGNGTRMGIHVCMQICTHECLCEGQGRTSGVLFYHSALLNLKFSKDSSFPCLLLLHNAGP